jgi:hypothetical protein
VGRDRISPLQMRVLLRIDVDGPTAVEPDADALSFDGEDCACVAVEDAEFSLRVARKDDAVVGRKTRACDVRAGTRYPDRPGRGDGAPRG